MSYADSELARRLGSSTAYERAYAELDDFERGFLQALDLYAYTSSERWAENGVQYVGSTGRTKRDAAISFLTDRGKPEIAAVLYPERR